MRDDLHDLAVFLLARVIEDLAAAGRIEATATAEGDRPMSDDCIRLADPARVIPDAEARRALVIAYLSSSPSDLYGGCGDDCEHRALGYALRCMGLAYSGHHLYRDSWRPPYSHVMSRSMPDESGVAPTPRPTGGPQVTDRVKLAAQAMLDQIRAQARDQFPEKSSQWRDVWVLRAVHRELHEGDMTGAPEFPEEGSDD